MKRFWALLLIFSLILPMAFLPSAFCDAEPAASARFGEILDALATFTSYASPQVLSLVEEAEGLLPDTDVQTDYTEEQLAKVAYYRHCFHRDCTVEEMRSKVKFYRYVRYSNADEREYADGEWAAIIDVYSEVVIAIDEADTPEEMTALRNDFFESIHVLPVYQEVYDAWEPVLNEVVNAEISRLAAKINAFRAGVGLPSVTQPIFIAVTTQNCVEDFSAFAEANLTDASSVSSTFANAVTDAVLLGLYADKAEMQSVWDAYRYAVDAATAYASPAEIALNNKKNAAVAALKQAIADSAYIQRLTGADYALYQELPNMMYEQLAEVDSEQEVDRVLGDYLALLEPEALQKPTSRLSGLTIAIIVLACVTVVLFAAYFVMRFRRGAAPKGDKKGAEQMLAELRGLSAEKAQAEGDSPDEAQTAPDEEDMVSDECEPAEPSPSADENGTSVVEEDASSAGSVTASPDDDGEDNHE